MRPRLWLLFSLAPAMLILSACASGVSSAGSPSPDNTVSPETRESPPTSNDDSTQETTSTAPTEEQTIETPDVPFPGDGPWEVTFTASDQRMLHGTLFGQGDKTVILSHMYLGDQDDWYDFSQTIVEQGYRVLTFDFRGYGEEGGKRNVVDAPIDLKAAVSFLREHDAEEIILIGAGLGGMASIRVAAEDGDIAGLAVISSPRSFEGLEIADSTLHALTIPSLWLGARNDMTQAVEDMFEQARGSDKELWIYEGSSLHGTFIFEGADGPDLERRLVEFVIRILGT